MKQHFDFIIKIENKKKYYPLYSRLSWQVMIPHFKCFVHDRSIGRN